MNKKRTISLLTLLIILLNMFSPYTMLLVKAATGTMESDSLVFHNCGVTTLDNGKKVIKLELALLTSETVTGGDIQFEFDKSKVVICRPDTGATGTTNMVLNKAMIQTENKFATVASSMKYTDEPEDESGNKKTGIGRVNYFWTFENDINPIDEGYQYGCGEPDVDLPGQKDPDRGVIPLMYCYFTIVDSSIDENALPADLFKLTSNGESLPTGARIPHLAADGITPTSTDINSINYGGFVEAETPKTIVGISKKTDPTKVEYIHGDAIDLSGGKIDIEYDDGTHGEIDMTDSTITFKSPSDHKADVNNPNVVLRYGSFDLTIPLTVTDEVETLTYKSGLSLATKYEPGDDLTGATLEAIWKSGKKETLTGVSSGVTMNSTVASIDTDKGFTKVSPEGEVPVRGTQKIEFTYEGKKAETTITVNDTIVGITVKQQPNKKIYKSKENLDLTGAKVSVTLGSGGNADISLPNGSIIVSGYNNTLYGQKQNLSVTFKETTITAPTTIDVEVYNYVETANLTPPSDVTPTINKDLDLTGTKLQLNWKTGNATNITDITKFNINYDKTKTGSQKVTLTYELEYTLSDGTKIPEIISKDFNVTVMNPLTQISILEPSKKTYYHGETFNYSDAEITVTYANGDTDTESITSATIKETVSGNTDISTFTTPLATAYTNNTLTKNITIEFSIENEVGNTILGSTNYDITITNHIKEIKMGTKPDKLTYNLNEQTYDLTSTAADATEGYGDIIVIYQAGNSKMVKLTDATLTPLNTLTNTAGNNKTVTVTYGVNKDNVACTTSFTINVIDSVSSIVIDENNKIPENQKYGETINLNGAQITVTKGSGTTTIPITTDMVTYDNTTLGEQTITITYGTKTDGTPATTTAKVIVQDYVKEIILNKTEISGKYGDELADLIDDNGLTYKIVYAEAGETLAAKPVTESMIDGYNKETLDEQNLNVKYIDEEEGTYKNTPNEYLKPIKITLAKEIDKIEITAPRKTEYIHGEGFDLTGGEILITYTDTSTATRTMTTNMIYENDGTTIANLTPTSYGSTNKVSKTLKIKYEEDTKAETVDYPVTIINAIEKIELIGNPKTQYNVNEGILEGLSVKITRKVQKDGVTDVKEVKVGENEPTEDTVNPIITGFNTTTEGTRVAVITYIENGVTKTVNYEYTVTDSVTSISIHTAPKEGQKYGEELDLTGAKINVVKGSATEQKDITTSMIKTGTYNKNQLGEQTVTVQYGTKANGTPITTTFKVTVQDYVKSVEIVPPSKIEYQYNTDLDLSDSKIIKTMASAPDKPQTIQVTGDMISGYDKTQTGTQTVKITYKDDKTYTKDFQVTVTRAINNIELINEGFKTQYLYNENLDLSTLKLKITYIDGTTKNIPVTTAMINGYNPKQLGEQNITLKYETFEQGLQVTVQDYIKDIELTLPTKKQYELEEELDLTGGSITTIMASGAVGVTVPLTQGTITGFDSTTPGTKTINVTYEEKSKTFKVVVKGPEEEDYIKEEQFNEPTKKEYKVGDTIDLTGGSITQIMASGKIVKIDLTNDMIQGFDSTTPGTKTIKVSYNGKTYTYTINVKDEILGISIQTLPDKLEYKKGEELNITGATLNVISLSGVKTINITKEMIQGYDSSREGTQVISVNYEGFSAQFSITVQKEDKEANDNKPNNNKPNNNTNKPNTKPSDKVIYVPVKEEKPVEEQPKQEIPEEPKEEEPKQEEVKKPEINKDDKDKVVPVIGTTNNNQTPPTSGLLSKQNMLYLLGGILGLLGISLIIALIEKNKKNVKIYLEEGGQKVLVGKEKVSKKNTVLDLNKYYDEYQEDKYQIVLSKSINKKLDQRSVNLIVHDKKESFVVNSNNESCSYRI